ncbi:multicopper oxidase domain-containing protein [Paenibacillus sp. SYP-B3998]|uniref:Copper-containing nitrite reductase n=1 Tax=Paenibacillus sp. SYP-B3998 TaxID=2678564 RepID=A0A6G3ZUU3_9BACL|nr:multicopper oxidase domain-containing protein [Paenibacillus sp. SYP-B3998]NEW05912.1 multicopper oxidase domain-containing protein [Paenibacillus sp. SYP-B3998]
MNERNSSLFLTLSIVTFLVFAGCSHVQEQQKDLTKGVDTNVTVSKVNQPPVELVITRKGTDVFIEMTAQITDIEISKGVMYNAWTFNGIAPGPVLRVREGDMLHMTLKNLDPSVPHSLDVHAVHAAPSKSFIDVLPDETGTFVYPATSPGVFMYHCGTKPVLLHLANGMFGVIIVEPKNGYPTDKEVNREYVITQNEWYKENDYQAFQNDQPQYVVFNGNDFGLKEHPLLAKVGDKVRLYVNNLGPNHVSSFHVVGTLLDTVYVDGNPRNVHYGLQTVMLPASGGAVVEFWVTEEGDYPIVTHQFNDASKGAVAILRVTKDGLDTGEPAMSH